MEGLGQDRRLAPGDTAMAQGDGGEAGDEHDAQLRPEIIGAARQLNAVEPRHDHIGEQQIDRAFADPGERGIAIAYGMHIVAGATQGARQKDPEIVVVLGEKNTRHHHSRRGYSLTGNGGENEGRHADLYHRAPGLPPGAAAQGNA